MVYNANSNKIELLFYNYYYYIKPNQGIILSNYEARF